MNPAPYPNRNTEELEAVRTLQNLLDLKFAKPDIKCLDNRPNTDGTIELVDEKQRPLGAIQIQLKKIPDGQVSFQCPVELVAYSEQITLPFILICIDVGNKKGYFCHLHRSMMPALRPDQQSFVIKFDPQIHSISNDTQYLRQWIEIIEEYKKRVSDYPRLREIEGQLNVSAISKDDRIYFQQFIEHVNRLLEYDFPVVKEAFFQGIWKLGVAVFSADPEQVCFQLFKIFPGDPDLRVTGISGHPTKPSIAPTNVASVWLQGGRGSNVVQYHWTNRSFLKAPPVEAEKFVFKLLDQLTREMEIPLFGEQLAVEYLFWFVDNFGQSIGVEPADRLSVARLNYGLFVYLPAWASLAVPKYLGELVRLNRQNLRQIAHMVMAPPFEAVANVYPPSLRPTAAQVTELIASGKAVKFSNVRFTEISVPSLANSVHFLIASQIEWIDRPYKPKLKNGQMIWSGYDVEALRYNIPKILIDSLANYHVFVTRNRICLKNSLYLHQPISIIYTADLTAWTSLDGFQKCPILECFRVKNADQKMPRVTFVDRSETPNRLLLDGKRLTFDGVEREVVGTGGKVAGDLFKKLPMLHRVYEMLTDDLKRDDTSSA